MLIVFSTTIPFMETLDKGCLGDPIREALRAHRLGYHIVTMRRDIAEWIIKNMSLNDRERATIGRIKDDVTQHLGLANRAIRYIRLVDKVPGSYREIGNAIDISVEESTLLKIFEQPVLLVEDIQSDGELYRLTLENMFVPMRMPHPRFELQHGGGARIVEVFRSKVRDSRIVFAIYDSDRMCPQHSDTSKSHGFQEICASSGWPLAFWRSPPCHEAENMIPFEVICNTRYLDQCKAISHLIEIAEKEAAFKLSKSDRYWLYFDIKQGMSPERYSNINHEATRNWIKSKLQLVPRISRPRNTVSSSFDGRRSWSTRKVAPLRCSWR